MKPLAFAALLVAVGPVHAQDDPLAPLASRFRADVQTVGRLAATAALVHERTGLFPSTPFDLLGSVEAGRTGLRSVPLSALEVSRDGGGGLRVVYVPLPSPYVRDDEVVTVVVHPDSADGAYRARYEIHRRADLDLGGAPLTYERAPGYRVERGIGTICFDADRVRALLATGDAGLPPQRWSEEPLAIRLHPVGRPEPVFYADPPIPDR